MQEVGQIALMTSRERALRRQCPTCGAQAGLPCLGARGKTRKSFHTARLDGEALGVALSALAEDHPNASTLGYVVYAIIAPSGQPVYVGQTGNFRYRMVSHLRRAQRPCRFPPIRAYLHDLFAKGATPQFTILEHCRDEAESLAAETRWVERLSRDGARLLNNWRSHRAVGAVGGRGTDLA